MATYEVEVTRVYQEEHVTMLVRARSPEEAARKARKEVETNPVVWFGPDVPEPDFEVDTHGRFVGKPDEEVLE